jgi:hypothetical protein
VPACTNPVFNMSRDCCPHCSGDAYLVPMRLDSNVCVVRLDTEACPCFVMTWLWSSYCYSITTMNRVQRNPMTVLNIVTSVVRLSLKYIQNSSVGLVTAT